jgi:hypothetical protein
VVDVEDEDEVMMSIWREILEYCFQLKGRDSEKGKRIFEETFKLCGERGRPFSWCSVRQKGLGPGFWTQET